jgi:hypothetical protein
MPIDARRADGGRRGLESLELPWATAVSEEDFRRQMRERHSGGAWGRGRFGERRRRNHSLALGPPILRQELVTSLYVSRFPPIVLGTVVESRFRTRNRCSRVTVPKGLCWTDLMTATDEGPSSLGGKYIQLKPVDSDLSAAVELTSITYTLPYRDQ